MRLPIALLVLSAAAIAAVWAWLGAPVAMPETPLVPGQKLYCVSYAPFRGAQTPLDLSTRISAQQIEEDLTQLARISGCVRTYSVDYGLDQIPAIAGRLGLKVIQGLWLSSLPERNRFQIDTAISLVNRFPDVIQAIVVGNEVLLRGEMTATDLGNTIRAVKARVKVPVTYADVWEFWLRNRDLASAVDFITIHILPYWEDFPISAKYAAAHVASIRGQVVQAFAGREIVIGEVGWPSAGRMREGALPSRSNQARVIQDILGLAAREKFRVNVIEAFDQPWKRALEGTVGGHWGLLDGNSRAQKFEWGAAVSDHPFWKLQAGGGVVLAILVFAAAFVSRRGEVSAPIWIAVALNATAGGILIGWTIANVPLESLGPGGWLRSLGYVAVALAVPVATSAAMTRGITAPLFSRVIGPTSDRIAERLPLALGILLMATLLLAMQAALALVFDPRYRDFPFAPLTAAALPFLLHGLITKPAGGRGAAELAGGMLLALSVPYIALNENFANWQSLWLCAALAALAFTLVRARGARN
jgi:glucan 1,3-beta-glucosidase